MQIQPTFHCFQALLPAKENCVVASFIHYRIGTDFLSLVPSSSCAGSWEGERRHVGFCVCISTSALLVNVYLKSGSKTCFPVALLPSCSTRTFRTTVSLVNVPYFLNFHLSVFKRKAAGKLLGHLQLVDVWVSKHIYFLVAEVCDPSRFFCAPWLEGLGTDLDGQRLQGIHSRQCKGNFRWLGKAISWLPLVKRRPCHLICCGSLVRYRELNKRPATKENEHGKENMELNKRYSAPLQLWARLFCDCFTDVLKA